MFFQSKPKTILKGTELKKYYLNNIQTASSDRFNDFINKKIIFSWKGREPFYRHVSAQIKNGRAITSSIQDYYIRLIRKNKIQESQIIGSILKSMYDGNDFTTSIKFWIPQNELVLIAAGEQSKTLEKSLVMVVESHNKIQKIIHIFKDSMREPVMYLIVLYAMFLMIAKYVMPKLLKALPREKAIGAAQSLYEMTDIANSIWFPLSFLFLILIIVIVFLSMSNWCGEKRIFMETYFPYSFYRNLNGYMWLVGFSSLSATNIASVVCLQMQMKYANPWLLERLSSVRKLMMNGLSLPDALEGDKINYNFPNPDMIDDIRSIHEYPDFPERILVLSNQWADEIQKQTEEQGKRVGGTFKYLMMGFLLYFVVASNSLSMQLGAN